MFLDVQSAHCSGRVHRDRKGRRQRKFHSSIVETLRGIEGITFLGKDRRAAEMLGRLGLPPRETTVCRVGIDGRVVHVIGVSNRIWHARDCQSLLDAALKQLKALGHRCATIPQRAVEALPHSGFTNSSTFFDLILHRACRDDVMDLEPCRFSPSHDPLGCYAVNISTGRSCQA
jgi:hypothetical protein